MTSQLRGSDKSPIQHNTSKEIIKEPFHSRARFMIKLDDRPGEKLRLDRTAGMGHASDALSRDCCLPSTQITQFAAKI